MIKLGGSAITDKLKFKVAKTRLLKKIAEELVEARISTPYLIVHGGGSFGHPVAKKYAIQKGFISLDQLEGFVETRIAMNQLNKLVIEAFAAVGLPVVSVPPASCIITHNGRIQTFFTATIMNLLKIGAIPVLFGDAVLDIKNGFAILSGDQLIVELAARFNASRIVVGLNVDGLYKTDPEIDPTTEFIEQLTILDMDKGLESAQEVGVADDVTGGMRQKIEELIPALEAKIPVVLINLNKPKRLVEAIQGKKTRGTYLYP